MQKLALISIEVYFSFVISAEIDVYNKSELEGSRPRPPTLSDTREGREIKMRSRELIVFLCTVFFLCGEKTTVVAPIVVTASCWISDNIWNLDWKLQSSRAAVKIPHLGGRLWIVLFFLHQRVHWLGIVACSIRRWENKGLLPSPLFNLHQLLSVYCYEAQQESHGSRPPLPSVFFSPLRSANRCCRIFASFSPVTDRAAAAGGV